MTSPAIVLMPRINQVSGIVVNAAMRVHSLPRAGSARERLSSLSGPRTAERGFMVETQEGLPVVYEGEKLALGYGIDLVVENMVIVDLRDQVRGGNPSCQRDTTVFVLALQREDLRPAHQFPSLSLERRDLALLSRRDW